MAKTPIVINASRPAETDVANDSIMAKDVALFHFLSTAGSAGTLVSNADALYRMEQIGSQYINGYIQFGTDRGEYLYKGSDGSEYQGMGLTLSTKGMNTTVPADAFMLMATQINVVAGKEFSSAVIGLITESMSGSGVTMTYKLSAGLLHTDNSIDIFAESVDIVLSTTESKYATPLLTTTARTSVVGDRIIFKAEVLSLTGTHNTSNFCYPQIQTQVYTGRPQCFINFS